ncbi:MAG: hypothetical protein M9904_05230 [Chitinophagaceae bacterium]|nr:hypothetical protein [Chitinophagaceae bacterium]
MRTALRNIPVAGIASVIFIILFTYTAVNKLIDYPTFRIALGQSPILKYHADFVVVAVPVIELIIVAMLVVAATRRVGLWASLFLMVAFTLYVSYLMFFAGERPCNCGGIMKALSWKQHLAVNIALSGLAFWAVLTGGFNKNTIAIDRISRTPA